MKKPGVPSFWQKFSWKGNPVLVALLAALLLATVYNLTFWQQLLSLPDISVTANAGFLIGTGIVISGIFFAFLSLCSYRYLFKTVLILAFFLTASISYFSLKYGTVIDYNMISNILETDIQEARELFSPAFALHLLFFAGLPTLILARTRITWKNPLRQLAANLLAVAGTLLVVGAAIYLNYSSFALIGRQHKSLRMYINPTYALYSVEKYYRIQHIAAQTVAAIAEDAVLTADGEEGKRKLLGIFVVGESARAREFTLNGYERETNPCLARQKAVSFSEAYSSGTSTAESLPCMFSHLTRENYSVKKAAGYENVLDILHRLGIDVLWRDNNSSSKGVALRVNYEKISAKVVPDAESLGLAHGDEYFDEALLYHLQEYIDRSPHDNILIVLHQKGSHGPAYYKRYPEKFRRFTPEYMSNTPQNSTRDELINAYDNTILYTDYFLAQTIELLKKNADNYDTFLFYMSDHGESLGENGIYLHGLPYFMAPDEQRHIAAVTWLSESTARHHHIDMTALADGRNQPISHDYIFHSLLGIFGVKSIIYDPGLDLFHPDKRLARK
ncbi:MAG: phosphoethanolamine--lipid A transferase [Deltaproteobacteria bacterium]|nr:phosphoethanolamine--lipid A transferase [Deltaproteobacteria bacterium]